ncbi:MAG TPA: WD40 repeat domain-containing serine/threonine protein kinase [Kofleriaceae bacterium]|nr:WD40 repeat domain-containing serine/threonine protein kinase [Kofleriaceae bacterium]
MQCGDGSDETRTRTSTGSDDSDAGDAVPAPRHPSATPSGSERLPAPLQYRDPARYDIVAEHGRGGLGRVFRARDKELGRDVALKELLSRGSTTELRFFREALITARLEHPGIVPVHEAGRWPDGTPFYAMKLVAGRPLKALIDDCKTLEDRLALLPHVIAVADAIAYAHDRKIIHRDLKPSNIIVGDFGETVVIDWGLAKDISDQAPADDPVEDGPFRTAAPGPAGDGVTVAGSVVGTPAYMSPEQARGDLVDERTDVYAIGAILRELTGTRSPRDLAAIAHKCLEASPATRYASAREIAVDLRRFVNGARVHAQRYSTARLLWMWVRRHRTRAIAIAAALAATAITGLLSLSSVLASRDRARRNQALAETESRRSAEERVKAVQALAELTLVKDPTEAARLANELPDLPATDLLRRRAAAAGIANQTFRFASDIYNVTLLPVGERALVLTTDRRMQLIDAKTKRVEVLAEQMTLPARLAVNGDRLFFSVTSDSYQLVERSIDGPPTVVARLDAMPIEVAYTETNLFWVTADGRLFEKSVASSGITIVAHDVAVLARRGPDVVWCTNQGELHAGNASQSRRIARCEPSIQFVSNGEYLIFPASANSFGIVGPENHVQLVTGSAASPVPDIDFGVARSGLAALVDPGHQGVFARAGASGTETVATFESRPTAAAAGGSIAVWGFSDGTMLGFDVASKQLWVYQVHQGGVDGLLVTESKTIFSFSYDTVRVWSGPEHGATVIAKASPYVFNAALDASQERVVLDASTGKAVMVSLEESATSLTPLHEHEGYSFSSAWCGAVACTGGWDATVRCSDPGSGEHTIIKTTGPVRWIASGTSRCYFGTATGGVFATDSIAPLYVHKSELARLALSADQQTLASIDLAGTLISYDARSGTRIAERPLAHSVGVPTLQWDEDTFWTAGLDGNVCRWDRNLVLKESHRFRGASPRLAISRAHIAVAHSASILWIRNQISGVEVELDLHASITGLTFSNDGLRLAVATSAGEIYVIDPATARSIDAFRVGSKIHTMLIRGTSLVAISVDGTFFRVSLGISI